MSKFKPRGIVAALATAGLVAAGAVGFSPQPAGAADASDLKDLVSIRDYSVIDIYGRTMVTKQNSYQYNSGKPVCPVALLRNANNDEIEKSKHFLTYYFKNRAKGTATVVLRGIHSAGYKDAQIISYKISSEAAGWKVSSSGFAVSLIADQTWNGGTAITPAFRVKNARNKLLVNGKDYTASFSNNKAVGTATLVIKGKNNYKGQSVSTTFKIRKLDLAKCTMTAFSAAYNDGSPVTTVPTLTYNGQVIPASGNYSVEYANNTQPGSGIVSAVALADSKNVSGVKQIQFDITVPLSNKNINVAEVPVQTWTGNVVQPTDLKVTYGTKPLVANVDYEIAGYADNINAGKASIILKGKGAYSGTRSVPFYVKYQFSSRAKVVLQSSELHYTAAPLTPTVIVTDQQRRDTYGDPVKLTEGSEYTVQWQALSGGATLKDGKPLTKGVYKVTATGMGDYYDSTNSVGTSTLTVVD